MTNKNNPIQRNTADIEANNSNKKKRRSYKKLKVNLYKYSKADKTEAGNRPIAHNKC